MQQLQWEMMTTALIWMQKISKDLHYYTRAEIFLTYISYITVRMKIFDQFHYSIYGNMEEVKKRYPDTYNFLYSLQHELAHMGNFIMPY